MHVSYTRPIIYTRNQQIHLLHLATLSLTKASLLYNSTQKSIKHSVTFQHDFVSYAFALLVVSLTLRSSVPLIDIIPSTGLPSSAAGVG